MFLLTLFALVAAAIAQQIGTNTPEVHPLLPSQKCTSHGCTTLNTSIVLDSQYRWLHAANGYNNCQVSGGWNSTLCPDGASCAQNCAIEGVDYSSYGISVSNNALTLSLYLEENGVATSMASPRVYLLANETSYDVFKLLNQEIAYDVDLSLVPCGINGALYLSEMLPDGGYNAKTNPAGAKYGTGYCDAQCPKTPFVVANGTYGANLGSIYGNCCNEMDLWEANNAATQLTPHPCKYDTEGPGPSLCTGTACGGSGICDQSGCEYNPYRQGHIDFYGPGTNYTINTLKPFTVITQFITSNGKSTGHLSEIRRFYKQNGKVISNPATKVSGMKAYNSISDAYCTDQKAAFGDTTNTFKAEGGMAQFSKAVQKGMVLVFSIWDDASGGMTWLDSVTGTGKGSVRGPCSVNSGNATYLQETYPGAKVTFSNIKTGDLGSTF